MHFFLVHTAVLTHTCAHSHTHARAHTHTHTHAHTHGLWQRDETKRSLAPKLIGLQWRSVDEVLRVYRASGFVNDLQRDELIRFGLVEPGATK